MMLQLLHGSRTSQHSVPEAIIAWGLSYRYLSIIKYCLTIAVYIHMHIHIVPITYVYETGFEKSRLPRIYKYVEIQI